MYVEERTYEANYDSALIGNRNYTTKKGIIHDPHHIYPQHYTAPLALKRSAATVENLLLAIDLFFQFLPHFKEGQLLRGNLDILSCFGVSPRIGLVIPHHEAAKPSDLDPAALSQLLGKTLKDQIDNIYRFLLRKIFFLAKSSYKSGFVHELLL